MKKSIIGITCDYDSGGSRDSILIGKGCLYLSEDYIRKISELGAIPLPISPSVDPKDNEIILNMCDGILLTGGRSIDPDFYGKEPAKDVNSLSIERYRKELPFIKQALALNKPILGICAGHQAINVACGGTLIQNINLLKETKIAHIQQAPRKEPTHHIKVERNSLLNKLVGDYLRVNSYHQQAIDKLGKDIVVTAKSTDGIIEAIEMKNKNNVMGVQWHPESLDDTYANNIFLQFISWTKHKN